MRPVRAMALMLAALAGTTAVRAAPVDHWFEQANRFYQSGQYDSAEAYYRKIVDSGVKNGAVFYNFGNACFKQNKVGLAILCYERAQRLAPADREITHNLRFVRAGTVDRIPEPEHSFFEQVLLVFHNALPLNQQLWVLTGLLYALALMFAWALYASRNMRLWLIYVGSLVLIAGLALGASAGVKIHELETVESAVVMKPSVDALNAPEGDKVLFSAHEGTTFRIRQQMTQNGEWWLVSLPNGLSGWVSPEGLEKI